MNDNCLFGILLMCNDYKCVKILLVCKNINHLDNSYLWRIKDNWNIHRVDKYYNHYVKCYEINKFIDIVDKVYYSEKYNHSYKFIYNIKNEIGHLINLTSLSLSNNLLKTVPSSIGKLSNLTILCLSNNKLICVPFELVNLKYLNLLWLYNNNLRMISSELMKLIQLMKFNALMINNSLIRVNGIMIIQ